MHMIYSRYCRIINGKLILTVAVVYQTRIPDHFICIFVINAFAILLLKSLVTSEIVLVIIVIKNIWCCIIKMCYLTSNEFNMSHLFIGACICENSSSFWTLFWPIHIYSEPWFWRGVWARSICKFWYSMQMVQKTFLLLLCQLSLDSI